MYVRLDYVFVDALFIEGRNRGAVARQSWKGEVVEKGKNYSYDESVESTA
jgi:hypothetical protein